MTASQAGRPRAIVFDLDGTLVDSLSDITHAVNRMLEELNRRPVTMAEARNWLGDGATVLVERALDATGGRLADTPIEGPTGRFRHYYSERTAQDTTLFAGVTEALAILRDKGHRLGVCTNKPFSLSMEVLKEMGIAPMFDAVLGGDSAPVRKPDPGHLRATLAAMGANENEALMVGDSGNDVAAARGAGIPVVVVSFGYSKIPPRDLGADYVIDGFDALPAVVEQIA